MADDSYNISNGSEDVILRYGCNIYRRIIERKAIRFSYGREVLNDNVIDAHTDRADKLCAAQIMYIVKM